jgi:hypothetical protein
MSDNRPIAYLDPDGTAVYRVSAIGKPLRCLAAARQGYDPLPAPDYLIRAAEEGNRFEPIVINRLRDLGWKIGGTQGVVEIVVRDQPRVIVRGHMDAAHAIDPLDGTDRVLEVKSMSARVFDSWLVYRWERFPTYAAQLTGYMTWARRPALYAVINRDDPDQFELLRFEEPPLAWDPIASKLLMSEHLAATEILPVCSGGSEYTCPYDYLCDRREIYFAELESGDDELLLRTAEAYREVLRMEKEIEARKDELRDELATLLGGREKASVAGWKVSRTESTRRYLDEKAIRLELGDEAKRFEKETRYHTVRVTPPKGDR